MEEGEFITGKNIREPKKAFSMTGLICFFHMTHWRTFFGVKRLRKQTVEGTMWCGAQERAGKWNSYGLEVDSTV